MAANRKKGLDSSTTDISDSIVVVDGKKDLSTSMADLSLSTSFVKVGEDEQIEGKDDSSPKPKQSVADLKDELDQIKRQNSENEKRESEIHAEFAKQELVYVPPKVDLAEKKDQPKQSAQDHSPHSKKASTKTTHKSSSSNASKVVGAAFTLAGIAVAFFSLKKIASNSGASNQCSLGRRFP
jgi:hypothetical protein